MMGTNVKVKSRIVAVKDWSETWRRLDRLMSDGEGRTTAEIIRGLELERNSKVFTYVHRRLQKLVSSGLFGVHERALVNNRGGARHQNVYFAIDPNDVVDMGE